MVSGICAVYRTQRDRQDDLRGVQNVVPVVGCPYNGYNGISSGAVLLPAGVSPACCPAYRADSPASKAVGTLTDP